MRHPRPKVCNGVFVNHAVIIKISGVMRGSVRLRRGRGHPEAMSASEDLNLAPQRTAKVFYSRAPYGSNRGVEFSPSWCPRSVVGGALAGKLRISSTRTFAREVGCTEKEGLH